MNPFEENNESTTTLFDVPEIWMEVKGRRKTTCIAGLPYSNEELKEHLKSLKKKHGCNGSLQDVEQEGKTCPSIQLQGDHMDNIISYFKPLISNIKIRGCN